MPFKVIEQKEIETNKADETKTVYVTKAEDLVTGDTLVIKTEEPFQFQLGETIEIRADKSQRKLGE